MVDVAGAGETSDDAAYTVTQPMREVIGVSGEERAAIPRHALLIGGDSVEEKTGREQRSVSRMWDQVNLRADRGDGIIVRWGAGRRRGSKIAIGRPIGNTRVYILDEEGEPVPVGSGGEIYIWRSGSGARVSEPSGADGGAVCA